MQIKIIKRNHCCSHRLAEVKRLALPITTGGKENEYMRTHTVSV